VKPSRFKYAAPETCEEALTLLAEHGDEAKVLAGGQSLVPLMNLRLAKPSVLVDINRIDSLAKVEESPSGAVIGATVRQAHAAHCPRLRATYPILTHALQFVGHTGTRTRGTLGGSAAHADPAAELPMLLVTLGARLEVARVTGSRTIAASDFFLSTFETALAEDELLTSIHLDSPPPGRRWGYEHVARRHGDFALVGVAVTADIDEDGVCRAASIGIAGVADVPVLAAEAAQTLLDTRIGSPAAEQVARAVSDAIHPPDDVHASAEYRRRVAGVLVARALATLGNDGSKA
jgi:aerobic carbon-monoxide dehydrogenase medium subunit